MGNRKYSKNRLQSGFTLVELLIVAIILAILAAIVVPQFSSSTEDANIAALRANLAAMRNAIELYSAQHDGDYPGEKKTSDGSDEALAGAAAAFETQLTTFSDRTGKASNSKDETNYPFGPYLKGAIPANPFNGDSTVTISDSLDITDTPVAGDKGYLFYRKLGRLIADDGTTIGSGTTADF